MLDNDKRELVYIAGPYKGANYIEVSRNILRAQECALWCAENNIFFFCPHTHSAHNNIIIPSVPSSFFYALDLKILSYCKGIILLHKWDFSEGATREYYMASDVGLAIFKFPEENVEILEWYKQYRNSRS